MTRLYSAFIGGGVVLLIVGAIYALGWDAGDDEAKLDTLRSEAETRERMDHADTGSGDPVRDAEWLRERGRR